MSGNASSIQCAMHNVRKSEAEDTDVDNAEKNITTT